MLSRLLKQRIGATVHLQRLTGRGQPPVAVPILGLSEGHHLVVGTYGGRAVAAAGEACLVRFIADGRTYAFRTRATRVCGDGYVYLQYPQATDDRIRSAPRVSVDRTITLTMHDGVRKTAVKMVDIGVAGAQLVCDKKLGQVGERFFIEMRLAPHAARVRLPCIVRYIRAVPEPSQGRFTYHHGVEFTEADAAIRQRFTDSIGTLSRAIANNVVSLR